MSIRLPRLIANHVLIEIPKEDRTKGGILMPSEIVEMKIASAGSVVGVGPECKYVTPGCFAFFKSMIGHKIEDDSLPQKSHYVVIAEGDLIGYYKKEDVAN